MRAARLAPQRAGGGHGRDALQKPAPTDRKELGREVPIGQGKVNFPILIGLLKKVGYQNPITIEREIEGAKQTDDILAAKAFLEKLIG